MQEVCPRLIVDYDWYLEPYDLVSDFLVLLRRAEW